MSMDSPEFRKWLGDSMAADAEILARQRAAEAHQQELVRKAEMVNQARETRARFTLDLARDVARLAIRKERDISIQGTAGWQLEPEKVVRLGSRTVSFGRRGPTVTRDFLSRTGHLLSFSGQIYRYKLLGRQPNEREIGSLERGIAVGTDVSVEIPPPGPPVESVLFRPGDVKDDDRVTYISETRYDSEYLLWVGIDDICGPPVTVDRDTRDSYLDSHLLDLTRYDEPNKYEAMLTEFAKGIISPPAR